MFNRHRIRFRLNAAFLLIVTFLLGIFGVINYQQTRHRLEADLALQVQSAQSRLAESLPAAIWNFDRIQVRQILRAEMSAPFIDAITLEDGSGKNTIVGREAAGQTNGKGGGEGAGKIVELPNLSGPSNAVSEQALTHEEFGERNAVGTVRIHYSQQQIFRALRHDVILLLIEIVVLDVVLLIALSQVLTRVVTRPIDSIRGALADIAEGDADLTKRLTAARADEYGEVVRWFNVFVGRLQALVTHFAAGATHFSELAGISQASSRKSYERMKEERQAVECAASSAQEISHQASSIAVSVDEASEAARVASTDATTGGALITGTVEVIATMNTNMDRTSQVMNELAAHGDRIQHTLQVINDIARQTDLLALNAAIEAARAGEQGRGFAIVADEVRKLSARTNVATGEIEQTIAALRAQICSAVTATTEGYQLAATVAEQAGETRKAFDGVHRSVKLIYTRNHAIAEAVDRQQAMVSELVHIVDALKTGIGETSTDAAQVAESAQELLQLAEGLSKLASEYRT